MVAALVVATILAFVVVELLRARGERALAMEPSAGALASRRHPALPEGRFYHPGHTWAQSWEEGRVAVGLDELGTTIMGPVDRVKLPKVGQKVHQGQVAWTIARGPRRLGLLSPVTGVVVEVNEQLERDPGLLSRSPYRRGWVYKAEPLNLEEDLKNLFRGARARRLMELARTWICFRFCSSPLQYLTYQDGGELVEGLVERLSDEEWEALSREIFLSEPGRSSP
jgi:glycine cleavage system H lipoate-binding protein